MMDSKKNQPETRLVENPANDHKRAAVHFLELVATGHIDEAYQKYASKNCKHHNPYFGACFTALQKVMQENHDQFPNMQLSVKNVIGEGYLVAIHSHVVQTPGETGMAAVHIFRFQDDQIVEFWDCGEPVPTDSPNEDGMF